MTNKDFAIMLHHEFPRDWHAPGHPIRDDWRDHIGKAKERSVALTNKFKLLDAPGNRIAFFREHEGPTEPLLAALEHRFGQTEWTFIQVDLPEDQTFGWKGDPSKWDMALQATGITLDTTNHKPFVPIDDVTRDPG